MAKRVVNKRRQPKPTFDPLTRDLSSRSAATRAAAAESLGLRGDPDVVGLLEGCLKDRSAEVRMRAIEAMGRLPGRKSSALIAAVEDTNELVRVFAAEAIEARREHGARHALRKQLDDSSPLVRRYVAAALGSVGSKEDRAHLSARLQRETSDLAQVGMLEGLWRLRDRSVLDRALRLLDSGDYHARCSMARALSSTFVTKITIDRILMALRTRLRKETKVAPSEAITDALRQVKVRQRQISESSGKSARPPSA